MPSSASAPVVPVLAGAGVAALLDASAVPALLCDAALRLVRVNARLNQRLGTRRWHGACLSDLLDDEELVRAAWRVLQEDGALELRARSFTRLSGGERFDVHLQRLPGSGDAAPLGLLIEWLPAQQADVSSGSAQLTRAFAHELRNPLGGLRGAAQLLKSDPGGPSAGECIAVIEAEVERLNALAERLLAAPNLARRVRFNVHAPLERARQVLEAGNSGLRCMRDYDPSLPELIGDPDRLLQALLNLGRNAVEAGATELLWRTRVERNVRLGVHTHRLALRLEVHDNGAGVPEHLRETLFLPLVTGHAHGSGFGLPTALAIAHELGGVLRFASEPGATCFWMSLPVR